ncbi:glycosyl-4,4'-diaponeurosporenoate acyltransferase CrtO family protein [Falsibacillus albus]|uniref:Glycosyl-4,4'-diaponeurosporenoate acyltransferase n=1 Tax=Falsibacillus albus TaxID=2478915 RepID=A0A3L7JYV2_9BACI|nr:glycosyl-4,4'-diaponeurosporenoate acyltransferase [Falsibacillus albus]RLQ95495.1 glycosyl-4,4'-diaponeurosporenoate acyltransferase [Falsibacillus albus]
MKVLLVNAAIWAFLHISISFFCLKLNERTIFKIGSNLKISLWEKESGFYQMIGIKKWKDRLPDAADWIRGFPRKSFSQYRKGELLNGFYCELLRAEISHWLQMLPFPLFFLFNDFNNFILNMAYAIFFNLPFILIQRFNRTRVEKLFLNKISRYSRDQKKLDQPM